MTVDEVLAAWAGGETPPPPAAAAPAPEADGVAEGDAGEMSKRLPRKNLPRPSPVLPPAGGETLVAAAPSVSSKPPVLVGEADNPIAVLVGAVGLFVALFLVGVVGPALPTENPGARTSDLPYTETALHGQEIYQSGRLRLLSYPDGASRCRGCRSRGGVAERHQPGVGVTPFRPGSVQCRGAGLRQSDRGDYHRPRRPSRLIALIRRSRCSGGVSGRIGHSRGAPQGEPTEEEPPVEGPLKGSLTTEGEASIVSDLVAAAGSRDARVPRPRSAAARAAHSLGDDGRRGSDGMGRGRVDRRDSRPRRRIRKRRPPRLIRRRRAERRRPPHQQPPPTRCQHPTAPAPSGPVTRCPGTGPGVSRRSSQPAGGGDRAHRRDPGADQLRLPQMARRGDADHPRVCLVRLGRLGHWHLRRGHRVAHGCRERGDRQL